MNNKKVISAILLVSDGPVEHEYFQNLLEINQEELIDLMQKHKFQKCSYRNFSNGIVSIHSGWKI